VLEKVVVKAKKLKEAKRENVDMVEIDPDEEMDVEDGVKNEEPIYSDEK
jgi:hypothetical protein